MSGHRSTLAGARQRAQPHVPGSARCAAGPAAATLGVAGADARRGDAAGAPATVHELYALTLLRDDETRAGTAKPGEFRTSASTRQREAARGGLAAEGGHRAWSSSSPHTRGAGWPCRMRRASSSEYLAQLESLRDDDGVRSVSPPLRARRARGTGSEIGRYAAAERLPLHIHACASSRARSEECSTLEHGMPPDRALLDRSRAVLGPHRRWSLHAITHADGTELDLLGRRAGSTATRAPRLTDRGRPGRSKLSAAARIEHRGIRARSGSDSNVLDRPGGGAALSSRGSRAVRLGDAVPSRPSACFARGRRGGRGRWGSSPGPEIDVDPELGRCGRSKREMCSTRSSPSCCADVLGPRVSHARPARRAIEIRSLGRSRRTSPTRRRTTRSRLGCREPARSACPRCHSL